MDGGSRKVDKMKDSNFYKWSVDKGDYKRNDEATITYMKKMLLKKRIKTTGWIFLYFSVVIVISYLIFAHY
jgi:hypothetical protein